MSVFKPDPIIVISVIYLCFPSFAQFLVTLVIRWRICFLPYHSMVPFQHFLMKKTYSFDDGTSGLIFIMVNSFASIVDYHLLIEKLLNPFHVRLQFTLIHMA